MINILKHGKQISLKIFFKVACPYCGCEFELESSDFTKQTRCLFTDPAWEAEIDCPECYRAFKVDNSIETRNEIVEMPLSAEE